MNISYSAPVENGWRRMKRTLFQPFDLGKWMVLGFTAWLAQLADGNGGGGGGQDGLQASKNVNDDDFLNWGSDSWSWFSDITSSSVGVLLVALVVVVVLVVAVLVLWISSRGRFMFLDNLVHNRTEVALPWREYRFEGDSLFLWQFLYAIVVLVIMVTIMGGFLVVFVPDTPWELSGGLKLLAAIGLGTALFVAATVLSFIDYALDQFVVPLMHKHRLSTTAAWGRFLPVFQAHPGSFVLFGLFTLAVYIALGIAYLIGGALTCCVGLLLLALPYLGSVITLPLSVQIRFMNLEFLSQFGDDYNLLRPFPDQPAPDQPGDGSGQFHTDGTVVRTEDLGPDSGGDEPGPQDT